MLTAPLLGGGVASSSSSSSSSWLVPPLLLLATRLSPASAEANGVALTPPMGWNPCEYTQLYSHNISD
jgi:hypothetical protein